MISRKKIYEMEFRDYSGVALESTRCVEKVTRTLSLQFRSIEPLQTDGDVSLYKACEAITGSTVTLNVLSDLAARDSRLVERFQRKARAAAKIIGPHVLSSSEASEVGGIHYCSIEHRAESQTLSELLEIGGPLDAERAVDIADQIASGLSLAHQIGVFHLNLTPQRIRIERDEWVLIEDFGFDTEAPLSASRSHNPDPRFASPEQMEGEAGDSRSDMYSLGAIVYKMLTNRSPIDCAIFDDAKARPIHHLIPPPALVNLDVPEALSAAVMKLLQREPSLRPTASEFQREMDEAMRLNSSRYRFQG